MTKRKKYICPYCGDECDILEGYYDDDGDEIIEWMCFGKCGCLWNTYGYDPADERSCWRSPLAEEDWVTD